MKIGFTENEVARLMVRLINNGWNPLGEVDRVTVHTPATKMMVSLTGKNGTVLKLPHNGEDWGVALFQLAAENNLLPITLENPVVHGVRFRPGVPDEVAVLDVRSQDIEDDLVVGEDENEDEDSPDENPPDENPPEENTA